MFRNPRSLSNEGSIIPSTGRPPTPPGTASSPVASRTYPSPMEPMTTPLIGRNKIQAKRTPSASVGKAKSKSNGNILNFFKRADSSNDSGPSTGNSEESLFLQSSPEKPKEAPTQTPTPPKDPWDPDESRDNTSEGPYSPSLRFHESGASIKKRRIEDIPDAPRLPSKRALDDITKGPFLEESDEDSEHERVLPIVGDLMKLNDEAGPTVQKPAIEAQEKQNLSKPIQLKREPTSIVETDEFDGVEDFIDDEFPEEGEEYLERKWMQEQAELEMGLEDEELGEDSIAKSDRNVEGQLSESTPTESGLSKCPICGGNTSGLDEQKVSIHVNKCLDGTADALPQDGEPNVPIPKPSASNSNSQFLGPKRFNKAAIARPGQENPFSLSGAQSNNTSSAFSKIMSGHAEDNAWAAAAASEVSSRGKPAYQRTCPFYKIMPGFFICVDAFRYGAVQGCNAYFLSHFHSDHYIGLTSQWCHGPIYCSHVTANLVRRQLRVDPKLVVDLEFEKKVEVPNTQGVEVTMIPANHCPGSSLFFFEKVVGKSKNPKVQKVLHCGDFRACPAHVQHPKLRPDILDSATGRSIAQQKIDVCYLDTTYLTPKYAFPSQEEVIRACSDMCVSLSKDFIDEGDDWEQTKKERAGAGMVKFVQKSSIKEEKVEDDNDVKIKIEDDSGNKKKPRGRLLVIVGTYSIGKERICLGVAKALKSKIYAPPNKLKVVAALEDPELSARMTSDPLEAQVHMQMLMEIRAETLADYLTGYKPHFSRIVGFRPSGWNYRPPNSRFTESPSVQTVLHSENWKSKYSMAELVPQRGSTREANCFGVPYSEHSSFRELTMFCCALRIDKIIPTVNVGSAKSREKMKGWFEKWAMEKKKNGLFKLEEGQTAW